MCWLCFFNFNYERNCAVNFLNFFFIFYFYNQLSNFIYFYFYFFFSILFCICFKYFVSLSISIWPILRKGERSCYFIAFTSVFKCFNSKLLMDCRTSLALVVCPCINAVVVYVMHSCCGCLLCGVFPASHQNSYFLVSGFKVWLHQSI